MRASTVSHSSLIASGGIDLLIPPDASRIGLHVFNPSGVPLLLGPLESFVLNGAMYTIPDFTYLFLSYVRMGPLVQYAFYVKANAGLTVAVSEIIS